MILTLIASGVYLAFTIPVSVFPSTDFPRIVIGVDNGVMPIDQMLVTITRPLEEAVNSVPGCSRCARSPAGDRRRLIFSSTGTWICSRRLQYVNAAISRVQPLLPPTGDG